MTVVHLPRGVVCGVVCGVVWSCRAFTLSYGEVVLEWCRSGVGVVGGVVGVTIYLSRDGVVGWDLSGMVGCVVLVCGVVWSGV